MFNYEIKNKTLIVSINGEIDDFAARNIRTKLDYLLLRKEIKNIIFDLTEIRFMDSAGIGLLIGRYKAIKAKNGQCALVVPEERVKKILKMSGLLNLFVCYESVESAVDNICEKIRINV